MICCDPPIHGMPSAERISVSRPRNLASDGGGRDVRAGPRHGDTEPLPVVPGVGGRTRRLPGDGKTSVLCLTGSRPTNGSIGAFFAEPFGTGFFLSAAASRFAM